MFCILNIKFSGEVTSDSMEHTTPVDEQKPIKQEEPEDEDYLCKTAGCVRVQSVAQVLIRL